MTLIRFALANGSTVYVNPAHVMAVEPTPGSEKRTNLTVVMGKTYLVDEPAAAVLARLRTGQEEPTDHPVRADNGRAS